MSTLRRRPNADGSVRWYLDFRDSKPPIRCTTVHSDDRKAAERWRAMYLAEMVRQGVTSRALTLDAWFADWLAARKRAGLATTRTDKYRYTRISKALGKLNVAEITKRDVEAFRDALDEEVADYMQGRAKTRYRDKTARTCFGLLKKMLKDACSGPIALRAREDDPAKDVQPPKRWPEREGPYLYPAEFCALVRGPRTPASWRKMITLATYLGLRRGELAALDWADVHLDMGYVQIHQAIDSETQKTKTTKTGGNRKVPIEAALVPLLAAMRREAKGKGRVFPTMPGAEKMARRLRRYLTWAGCTRTELHAHDETRRHMGWHDLRHTWACWRLIRGDHQKKVQHQGGWRTASMLDRYGQEAETFESPEIFGQVFPELPCLFGYPDRDGNVYGNVGTFSHGEAVNKARSRRAYGKTTRLAGLYDPPTIQAVRGGPQGTPRGNVRSDSAGSGDSDAERALHDRIAELEAELQRLRG